MHLWPEQQFVKKGFGTLKSPELLKLLDNVDPPLPDGFYDEMFYQGLNDIALTISEQPEEILEKIAQLLQEMQFKERITPVICADLSKIALELEQTNKDLQQKLKESEDASAQLKDIIKRDA